MFNEGSEIELHEVWRTHQLLVSWQNHGKAGRRQARLPNAGQLEMSTAITEGTENFDFDMDPDISILLVLPVPIRLLGTTVLKTSLHYCYVTHDKLI